MNYLFTQQVNAGFFSDFNVIIGCLDFILKNKITNFSFVWNNILYQSSKVNLFDIFFFKTKTYEEYDKTITAISIGATYYQPINPHEKFLNSYEVLNYFNYFENSIFLDKKNKCVKRENCLGVHVRGTDHGMHGPLLNLNIYFDWVDKKLNENNYSYIFLATDEEQYVDSFHKKYGDKVITNNNITRSISNTAIHYSNYEDKEKLIEDVMLDAISLSQCEEILITSSNVSAYTLAINPFIKYIFLDQQ